MFDGVARSIASLSAARASYDGGYVGFTFSGPAVLSGTTTNGGGGGGMSRDDVVICARSIPQAAPSISPKQMLDNSIFATLCFFILCAPGNPVYGRPTVMPHNGQSMDSARLIASSTLSVGSASNSFFKTFCDCGRAYPNT